MRRASRRAALRILAACLFALPFLTLAHPASAEVSFCPPGSDGGQCNEPRGVATDFETGRVYVADRKNNRVDVFKANGEFTFAFGWGVDTGAAELETCTTASGCQAGIAGAGAGQFSGPRRIAVDNVVGSASRHDVYVTDANLRVQRFQPDGGFVVAFGWGVDTGAAKLETCTTGSGCQAGIEGAGECQTIENHEPIAVGPGGTVEMARSRKTGTDPGGNPIFETRIEKFEPSGACVGEVALGETHSANALAVDSAGSLYIPFSFVGGIRKYDAAGAEQCSADLGIETSALGVDAADRLFVSQREVRDKEVGSLQAITEFDSACKPKRRFGYGKIQAPAVGLAAYHSADGDIFDSEDAVGIHYVAIPPPGPIVVPKSGEVLSAGNTKATVRAEINPEGKATSYHVDYLTQKAFEEQGGFAGPATKSSAAQSLEIPAGKEFRLRAAEATIGCPVTTQALIDEGKCLEPETAYRFRVVATNADGAGEGPVEGPPFTTKPSIEIGDVYATEVGTDAARINAEVNPLGIPAEGYFEYVEEVAFQQSGFAEATQVPDVEAGEEPIDFGSAETTTVRGASLSALSAGTTYRFRLVATNPFLAEPLLSEVGAFTAFRASSPEPCPANESFRSGASALLPDCRAYEMVSPLDKANGDIAVLTEGSTGQPAVLSQSSASGGKLAYGAYRSFGDAPSAPYTSQYIAARGTGGWSSHAITPPGTTSIAGAAVFDNEFRAFSADLCQGWLVPLAEPPLAEDAIQGSYNLYRRADDLCGGQSYEALTTGEPEAPGRVYELELQGLSVDGGVAVFGANGALEGSGAPPDPARHIQLYAKAAGQPTRFVCVLPGGEASGGDCTAGTNTLSEFGRNRAANVNNAVSADGGRIFWTAGSEQAKIYVRENPFGEGAECAEAGAPCTVAVSKGGEEESGTGASRYWAAAEDGSKAVFTTGEDLYEFDVDTETTKRIAGGVSGLVGASEDAERLYFASSEVLSGEEENAAEEKAETGKPNLYFHQAGAGSGTYRFIGVLSGADVNPLPGKGASSAVASKALFHNGRVSPDGLQAAFMSSAPLSGYDNADAANGKADTEVFLYGAATDGGAGKLVCASCNPSGARPVGIDVGAAGVPFQIAARVPVFEDTLYAPRVLAPDGSRLYFESQDALVPRDTNGHIDVYEWERAGAGDCDQADASFVPDSGGCVDLVSSGKSLADSEFVDASPSGNDVFFTTLASLLPQDYGLADIYDARVGGGSPPPPPSPPPCVGDACQSPAPLSGYRSPPSASFRGAGDPVAGSERRCPKGKRRVARAGKPRCASKRKRAHGKRQAQGRAAR